MNLIDLEDALEDILPAGFSIETNKHGQIVILTGLRQDEDGDLVDMDEEDFDPDADPDFQSLDDEDEED